MRAAVSVPANIAEGCGRAGDRDFRRFLRHSLGSACELEYYLLLLRDLGLIKDSELEQVSRDTVEVKRMLGGLIRQLKVDGEPPSAAKR
jgi:four helix bundle protein